MNTKINPDDFKLVSEPTPHQEYDPNDFKLVSEPPAVDDSVSNKPDISYVESALRAGAQGLSWNSVDEVVSALKTATDVVFDPNLHIKDSGAIYDKYKQNVKQYRDDDKAAMDANPSTYFAGEVAGGIASTALPFGLGAKLAGNSLKGAIALGTTAGFFQTDLTDGVGLDDVASVGLGAAGGAVGYKLGKWIGSKTIEKDADIKIKMLAKADQDKAGAVFKAIGMKGTAPYEKMDEILQKFQLTHTELAQKFIDDLPIRPTDNPRDIRTTISKYTNDLWNNKITPVFSDIDKTHPEGVIPAKDFLAELKADLTDVLIAKSDDEIDKVSKRISSYVADKAEKGENITMTKLQEIKAGIGKRLKSVTNSEVSDVRRSANTTIRQYQDKIITQVYGDSPDILAQVQATRRDYGIYKEVNDFMDSAVANYDKDRFSVSSGILNVKEKIRALGNVLRSSNTGATVVGTAAQAVGKVLGGINDPTLPAKNLVSLKKIEEKILAEPGRYEAMAGRILSSASRSGADFLKELSFFESVSDLRDLPMERTTDSIIKNVSNISNILGSTDPALAMKFKQAVESNDTHTIKSMMSTLARFPGLKEYIQPGIGIDGEAVTDADKAEYKASVKNSPLGSVAKAKMLKQFQQDARIVPIQPPQQPNLPQRVLQNRRSAGEPKF